MRGRGVSGRQAGLAATGGPPSQDHVHGRWSLGRTRVGGKKEMGRGEVARYWARSDAAGPVSWSSFLFFLFFLLFYFEFPLVISNLIFELKFEFADFSHIIAQLEIPIFEDVFYIYIYIILLLYSFLFILFSLFKSNSHVSKLILM
jgi:hypothetical protein